MKKLLFGLVLMSSVGYAAMDVKEVATNCTTGVVAVSTNTPPTAIPTTALSGRYKVDIINTSSVYGVAIGTATTTTFANGYLLTKSSDASTAAHTFNIPSSITIYGIGENQNQVGTINVRYLECK